MGRSEVDVKLPRFKMEEKYDLKDVLVAMGMTDVFDVTRSDFSGRLQNELTLEMGDWMNQIPVIIHQLQPVRSMNKRS